MKMILFLSCFPHVRYGLPHIRIKPVKAHRALKNKQYVLHKCYIDEKYISHRVCF